MRTCTDIGLVCSSTPDTIKQQTNNEARLSYRYTDLNNEED